MYAQDTAVLSTPIGTVQIVGDEFTLTAIRIVGTNAEPRSGTAATVVTAREQIAAWFAGRLHTFDLPLASPLTPRSGALRDGIVAVPYGDVASYGELARRLGSSPRAVGQACARNPFPIVVPCHRILAAGGSLGAYSAGDGPATKRWLLDHEQRHRPAAVS